MHYTLTVIVVAVPVLVIEVDVLVVLEVDIVLVVTGWEVVVVNSAHTPHMVGHVAFVESNLHKACTAKGPFE